MEKENKKIKDFFRSRMKKIHKNGNRDNLDANRVWKITIIIFITINLCVIVLSLYLFFQINKGEIFNIAQDSQISVDTISRDLLRDTISSFEKMSSEFEELKTKRLNVIDPSI